MFRILLFVLVAIGASFAAGAAKAAPGDPASGAERSSGFVVSEPVLSIAYIEVSTTDLLIFAHGETGLSAYTLSGHLVWRSNTPARVVASSGVNVLAYREIAEPGGELTRYGFGHGGAVILPVETVAPSPIAATTLLRTALAAIGPVSARNEEIYSDTGVFAVGADISTFVAVDADLNSEFPAGALIVATEQGEIKFFSLPDVRSALGL